MISCIRWTPRVEETIDNSVIRDVSDVDVTPKEEAFCEMQDDLIRIVQIQGVEMALSIPVE